MQRRLMVLVTLMLLMTAMLVASAAPTLAALRPPVAGSSGSVGTALPTLVCETTTVAPSSLIGWRSGECWVFHPVSF